MKKQGIEWLRKLDKTQQVLFCKNRVNHSKRSFTAGLTIAEYLIKEFSSFNSFIDKAFIWDETPEGHDYWECIADDEKLK